MEGFWVGLGVVVGCFRRCLGGRGGIRRVGRYLFVLERVWFFRRRVFSVVIFFFWRIFDFISIN